MLKSEMDPCLLTANVVVVFESLFFLEGFGPLRVFRVWFRLRSKCWVLTPLHLIRVSSFLPYRTGSAVFTSHDLQNTCLTSHLFTSPVRSLFISFNSGINVICIQSIPGYDASVFFFWELYISTIWQHAWSSEPLSFYHFLKRWTIQKDGFLRCCCRSLSLRCSPPWKICPVHRRSSATVLGL